MKCSIMLNFLWITVCHSTHVGVSSIQRVGHQESCTDPESFVRGGPSLTFFVGGEWREKQKYH